MPSTPTPETLMTLSPPIAARSSGRHRAPGERRRRPPHRRWATLIAAVVIVAIALGLAVWSFLRDEDRMDTTSTRYPGTAPAEWGPQASWSSPPIHPGTRPVPIGTDRIAMLTADRQLVLVEAADGRVTWRAPLPEGDVLAPPTATRIDGRQVIAAHVGSRLLWWSLTDGSRESVELPAGAVFSALGEVPLVALGPQRVLPVASKRSTPVTVPDGTTALAAHADGQVTLAGPNGWLHVGPDGSTRSSGPWENRSRTAPTVVGYTGGFILLVRPGDPATVEVHADRTTDVRYVFSAPIVLATGGRITWSPSPSGTWGILGRALVDLRDGRVEDLGAWSTRTVTADRAYGHIDGQTVVVGPGIPRGVVAPGEAVPAALTDAGALVRGPSTAATADAGADPRRPDDVVYLLPARRSAS